MDRLDRGAERGNGQGRTLEEARASLRAAFIDILAANRETDAMDGAVFHREAISVASE